MPHFERYIGIDYSGAETPDSSCKAYGEVHGEKPDAVWNAVKMSRKAVFCFFAFGFRFPKSKPRRDAARVYRLCRPSQKQPEQQQQKKPEQQRAER
jgi:hypothetical protein